MKTVLVVDDAIFMRTVIRAMLEKNGYQVVGEAADGVQAVAKYRELKPEIVTMDITMPGVDGIGALQRLMELDPNANVVMITALGQEEMVRTAIVRGAKGFIVKPFQEVDVIETLSKLSS